jgi:V/A-type H+-transporting ATPase subunit I
VFDAVEMARVRVQVPGRDAAAATHAIARLGLLHLIDVAHGRTEDAPAGSDDLLAAHRAMRDRLRRTLDRLGATAPASVRTDGEPPVRDFALEREHLDAALAGIETAVDAAWTAREDARVRVERAGRSASQLDTLRESGIDAAALARLRFGSACLAIAGGTVPATLSDFLSPSPHVIETLDAAGADNLAVVVVPASCRQRLEAALRLVHAERIDLPGLAAEAPGSLAQAQRALHDAGERLDGLAAAHRPLLAKLLSRAELCVLLLTAQQRFGTAGRFIVISGWLPRSDLDRIRQAIAAVSPAAVVDIDQPEAAVLGPSGVAGVPILHRNPLLLRPFQPLIELYDTPSYREIQPTAFFAVSFLLMFGLMFGDVGHGAVLMSAGYYLFRYVPRYLDYGILLMEAGAAAAFFGLMFGSLFGIPGALPVIWLEPARDITTFMRIAIMLGVALVSAGLVLNVFNSWRAGERASALFSIRGLFGAFLYWTALAVLVRLLLPTAVTVPMWGLAVLAGAAALLIVLRRPLLRWLDPAAAGRRHGPRAPRWLGALEGSVELVDSLFAYFANTLSFIRVAAFAAVHAGVFLAIFAVSDTLARTRFGGPLSLAALVVGNVVLILLEGLTVSVQVLRLEYYEFFGKFFRGGGERYRPLMLQTTDGKEGAS